MNTFSRGAGCVALLLALAASPAAHAQTYFSSDATINTTTPGDVVIGYNNGSATATASSPTVTLTSPGSIGHDVYVYNGSAFNMNANVGGKLSALNTSTVNINSGTLAYALFADNNSTVNINGGMFNNSLEAFNSGIINVNGGTFSNLFAYDSSIINLYGNVTAMLTNANANGFSQYTLSGSFSNNAIAANTTLNVFNNGNARFNITNVNALGGVGAVPEPGSVALLVGLGVTGAGFAAKRRRARA